jgi:hypothetical protein
MLIRRKQRTKGEVFDAFIWEIIVKWIVGGMVIGFLYGITHHGVSTINATIGAGIFAFIARWFLTMFFLRNDKRIIGVKADDSHLFTIQVQGVVR